MTSEEKHIALCNSFISQIKGIYANIEDVDSSRDFIIATGGYGLALSGLDIAIKALQENIEMFASTEEED
jgi:hypothetical protein